MPKTPKRFSTRSPLWKVSPKREVDDELAFHLQMRTAEYIEQGLTREQAKAKAQERFGNGQQHRNQCHAIARERNRRLGIAEALSDARTDLRFALRQLRRHPGFATGLLLTLTLGIGINIAGFSILQNALLAPLPYAEPERIMSLWEQHAARSTTKNVVGPANFMEWRDQNTSFDAMAAFVTINVNLLRMGEPSRAKARIVTDQFFRVFSVAPLLGRSLTDADFAPDAENAVVLSHSFWQRHFAGRTDVVGETMSVNGATRQIVGVMPKGFGLDLGPGVAGFGAAPSFYTQLPASEAWREARGRWLLVAARLSAGVSVDQARAEMATISTLLAEQFPTFDNGWSAQIEPLSTHQHSLVRKSTLTLFAAVGLLLLVVTVNVASLLVARAGLRGDEIAVRLALGAGPLRVARQILTEGALMAMVGGLSGLGFAWALLRLVQPLLPPSLAASSEVSIGGPLLLYSMLLLIGCTLLFGMAPAWHILPAAKGAGKGSGSSAGGSTRQGLGGGAHGGQRLRSAMVFMETALATVLLVVAGLLLRSILTMTGTDAGFNRGRILTATLEIPRVSEEASLDTAGLESTSFFRQLLTQAAALPGVTHAGAVSSIPMAGQGAATTYWPLDRPETPPEERQVADIRIVAGDYLETIGVPLIEGRRFDERDQGDSQAVALISQQVADRYWPQGGAVGQDLHAQWENASVRRVIGVVGDVKHGGFKVPMRAAIYFPHSQETRRQMTLTLRTEGSAGQLVGPLRQLVGDLAPTVPLANVFTLDDAVNGTVAQETFVLRGVGVFAVLSLVLAGLGLYSVTSYSTAQRGAEIALRMALGAGPGDIRQLVFLGAGKLVVAGLAAGLLAGLGAGRGLESQLFGVEAGDPLTFGVVAVVLLVAGVGAVLVPAVRAGRAAPSETLRG